MQINKYTKTFDTSRNEDGIRWTEALGALKMATDKLKDLERMAITEDDISDNPVAFFEKVGRWSAKRTLSMNNEHCECFMSTRSLGMCSLGFFMSSVVHALESLLCVAKGTPGGQ